MENDKKYVMNSYILEVCLFIGTERIYLFMSIEFVLAKCCRYFMYMLAIELCLPVPCMPSIKCLQ